MLKNNFLFIIGEFMDVFLRKNPDLTPKMPEYSAARLTKSYVAFYKTYHCNEFLESGKNFRVVKCGYCDYHYDEKYRQGRLKDDTEWCQIEIMAQFTPPDCNYFFVKAEDLEPLNDPDFKFWVGGERVEDL